MTSRADKSQAGFTLIEMIVVVAVLGLLLALVAGRGPVTSRALTADGAASEIAAALRDARARAIVENRAVEIRFDLPARLYAVDGGPPQRLPDDFDVNLLTTRNEVANTRNAGIRFEPDGSSSGGHVELVEGQRHVQIGVDWLTGRVTVLDE